MKLDFLSESEKIRIRERFMKKVRVLGQDECWLWTAATNSNGYGVMRIGGRADGKLFLAHRIAYCLSHSQCDADLKILHVCDNPFCCNPKHLFSGSQADNMGDMVRKNRHAFGSRNGQAKLDPDKVREIRRSSLSDRQLAKQFGVCHQVINKARTRQTWAHL